MLSHLAGEHLKDLSESEWEAFHARMEDSWTYWLDDCETFAEYIHHARRKGTVIFALKLNADWVGFLAFLYDTQRSMWIMEYMVTKDKRGMGMSKLILPTVSHAFESLGKKLGLGLRGNNEIAQLAAHKALGVEFPEASPDTLFIIDLVPWTWGPRYHISDQLVVSITTDLVKY